MANTSHIPSGNLHEVRPGFAKDQANLRLRAVPAPVPQEAASSGAVNGSIGDVIGPRKLVRPKLPAGATRERAFAPRGESPILAHQTAMMIPHDDHAGSHAEVFYFQKQVQTQTLMVFVLEDGEQVEGYIEWYARNAIKIRNGSRTLIYKSAIKYLYKAGENHTAFETAKGNR